MIQEILEKIHKQSKKGIEKFVCVEKEREREILKFTCKCGHAASKFGSSSSGSYSVPVGFEQGGSVRNMLIENYKCFEGRIFRIFIETKNREAKTYHFYNFFNN